MAHEGVRHDAVFIKPAERVELYRIPPHSIPRAFIGEGVIHEKTVHHVLPTRDHYIIIMPDVQTQPDAPPHNRIDPTTAEWPWRGLGFALERARERVIKQEWMLTKHRVVQPVTTYLGE